MTEAGHSAAAIQPSGLEKDEVTRTEVVEATFAPYTFVRSLRMGLYRPGFFRRILQIIATLRFPGVWVVMLQYSGLVGGVVTISTIAPQLLASPPYLWGASKLGLINIGGLIGTILGGFYTYLLADWTIKRQAKREAHGLAEPEARLPTMFPSLLISTVGFWIFGFCGAYPGPGRWVGLAFGLVSLQSMRYIVRRSTDY